MEVFNNVNSIFRLIAAEKLKGGEVVVDATAGNGNDIEYMLRLIGKYGFAYGFDIQETAVENTDKRLKEKFQNYRILHDGHENVDKYVEGDVDFAVFNLGYLPKGDHSLITRAKTTVESIGKLLEMLRNNGCIVVSAYVGHEGGMDEYETVLEYVSKIDQKKYNVVKIEFANQINTPPKMILIEKRKSK